MILINVKEFRDMLYSHVEFLKVDDTEVWCVVDVEEVLDHIPEIEAIPIEQPFLKMKYKGYTVYNSEWLKEHIDMEYHVIKGNSESKAEAIPIKWMEKWVKKYNKDLDPWFQGRTAVDDMLDAWEKENG